jgi:hypothetical protein
MLGLAHITRAAKFEYAQKIKRESTSKRKTIFPINNMSKTPTKKDGKGKLTERAYKGRIKGGQNYGPKVERKTHFIVSYQNTHI